MSSKNTTHSFHRILGRRVSDRTQLVFCSWNAEDCIDDVQADNVSVDDCLATNFDLTTEDLEGSLCCKVLDDVPFIESIPICTPSAPVKVYVILVVLVTVILVCVKSIGNICRIFLKVGFLTLRNSVGRCAFMCAVAQILVVMYVAVVISSYVALLMRTSLGIHNSISMVAVYALPTSLSFAVFAALSMAFNIIAVCRTAAMQGHDEMHRNEKRLTRLYFTITVVTVTYSVLFFGASAFLRGLGTFIILGATLLVSIFQIWLFRSALHLMQDLNSSIGNDTTKNSSRSRTESEFGMRNGNQNSCGDNKMRNSLIRLQQSSFFISIVSAICAVLLALLFANEFLRFEGALGFNPVRFVSELLQTITILFYMLILDSITSTLYKNKVGNRRTKEMLPQNSTVGSAI